MNGSSSEGSAKLRLMLKYWACAMLGGLPGLLGSMAIFSALGVASYGKPSPIGAGGLALIAGAAVACWIAVYLLFWRNMQRHIYWVIGLTCFFGAVTAIAASYAVSVFKAGLGS